MRNMLARRNRKPAELLLVPMIDIFTVLVTFLLMTAVFSRITVMELDLPSAAAGPPVTEPEFRLEVILRQEGFELTNGREVIAAVPKVAGEYDLKALSELAVSLKRDHPETDDASVLLEPEIAYDDLIQAMDAIRSTEMAASDPRLTGQPTSAERNAVVPGNPQPTRVALFTNIAVGDAPRVGTTAANGGTPR
jgi:biopolymer transport protein ExbD